MKALAPLGDWTINAVQRSIGRLHAQADWAHLLSMR
jgi:hypothetical protein